MELDATMRQEEREFHLKMMNMMTRNPVPSPAMPPPLCNASLPIFIWL